MKDGARELVDVASWASAIGTVGALGFTAFTVRRQVNREARAHDYHRRQQAKRVFVEFEGNARHANVRNDGPDAIYQVGVYVRARADDVIVAHGIVQKEVIRSGETTSFTIIEPGAENLVPIPHDAVYFTQFTDSNGYRWNRYMLGLLEEAKPLQNPEGSTSRSNARLVTLRVTKEPFNQIEVVNSGSHSIHKVHVYVLDAQNNIVTYSAMMVDTMTPGEHRRFDLSSTEPDFASAYAMRIVAEFTDASGRQWNRYMRGRLDEIGPMPMQISKRQGMTMTRKIWRPKRGSSERVQALEAIVAVRAQMSDELEPGTRAREALPPSG